jgi:MFS family permease
MKILLTLVSNIGNDTKALWHHHNPSAPPTFVANQQSIHVSILSVASCTGRLISGAGSDLLVKKLRMNRMWCLFISAVAFTAAQFSALEIENPHYFGLVSGLTGFAYGVMYGFFPSLLAQKFGVDGMSQNWGTIILAPVISGNLFNLLYGHVYDNHSVKLPDGDQQCLQGVSCYWTASLVALLAALVGAALTLGSIWKENRTWKHENCAQLRSDHDREV